MGHIAVSHVLALEVISLDTTLEAATLARSCDRHLVAFSENVGLDLLPEFDTSRTRHPKFLKGADVLCKSCLLEVAVFGEGQVFWLGRLPPL